MKTRTPVIWFAASCIWFYRFGDEGNLYLGIVGGVAFIAGVLYVVPNKPKRKVE